MLNYNIFCRLIPNPRPLTVPAPGPVRKTPPTVLPKEIPVTYLKYNGKKYDYKW